MKSQTPNAISSSVMKKIKTGEVRMKPRMYFVVLGLVSVTAILVSSVLAAYLFSIMFFWLRIQTADTMAYGARLNLANSINSFPIWALAVSFALLVVAIFLAHRYQRIYKYKVTTVATVLILSSLIIGLGISFFDFGEANSPMRGNESGLHNNR